MLRFLGIVSGVMVASVAAHAVVRIDLDNPNTEPLPLAVSTFMGTTPEEQQVAKEIREVIRANLANSALFNVLEEKAYLQSGQSLNDQGPIYNEWRMINAAALLGGRVEVVAEGAAKKIKVEFRLYDVGTEKQLVGRRYTVEMNFSRHVAHRVSDDVYTALTGEGGYFTTRIVHIGEEPVPGTTPVKIKKKLCVMDQDGGNYQCLTDGNHLVLTPRFNPMVQKIIYMSYFSELPRLYVLDLPTGKQTIVGDYEGLNSSPRFSPDGRWLAMTLTAGHEGNPEIYLMNISTKKLTRITFHRGIDTSPSFSPDGKWIVFNSDRAGKPALFIMDTDGNKVRRLTYGDGKYYAPEWSPRGDLVAFVKALNGVFHIGVIDPEGNEERLLTDSYMDESPTWSPNGRVIVFTRQDGINMNLWSVDLTGHNLRKLDTPTNASDPAWSPLLK